MKLMRPAPPLPALVSATFLCCAAHAGYASAVLVASDSQAAEVTARQAKGGRFGFVWSQLQELSGFYFER